MAFSGFSDNTTPQQQRDLPRISGSEAVIRSFLAEGVDTIFGYPGGAIIPVYDALYDYREQINHILVRTSSALYTLRKVMHVQRVRQVSAS